MATITSSAVSSVDETQYIYTESDTVYVNSNDMFSAYVNLKKGEFNESLDELDVLNSNLTDANTHYSFMVEMAAEDANIRLSEHMSEAAFIEFIDWMRDETDIDHGRYFDTSWDAKTLYEDQKINIGFGDHWIDTKGTANCYLSKSEVQGLKAAVDTYIKSLEADQSKQSIEVNQYLTRMNEGLGWWGGKLDSFDRLWSKITSNT